MNNKILIIDDKKEINIYGYNSEIISDENILEQKLLDEDVSLLLIQRELEQTDGGKIIKKLKKIGISVPMILISSKNNSLDILKGFDYGCDDYVTKPYNESLLKAKINSILNRVNQNLHCVA